MCGKYPDVWEGHTWVFKCITALIFWQKWGKCYKNYKKKWNMLSGCKSRGIVGKLCSNQLRLLYEQKKWGLISTLKKDKITIAYQFCTLFWIYFCKILHCCNSRTISDLQITSLACLFQKILNYFLLAVHYGQVEDSIPIGIFGT